MRVKQIIAADRSLLTPNDRLEANRAEWLLLSATAYRCCSTLQPQLSRPAAACHLQLALLLLLTPF